MLNAHNRCHRLQGEVPIKTSFNEASDTRKSKGVRGGDTYSHSSKIPKRCRGIWLNRQNIEPRVKHGSLPNWHQWWVFGHMANAAKDGERLAVLRKLDCAARGGSASVPGMCKKGWFRNFRSEARVFRASELHFFCEPKGAVFPKLVFGETVMLCISDGMGCDGLRQEHGRIYAHVHRADCTVFWVLHSRICSPDVAATRGGHLCLSAFSHELPVTKVHVSIARGGRAGAGEGMTQHRFRLLPSLSL